MSGWLRNLQGQLTDLASEVLSEATEEVADPESELQVANKKYAEAERQLVIAHSNAEALSKKVTDLEEQLTAKNDEVEALNTKFTLIVDSRDSEIRSLRVELERTQHRNESEGEEDEESLFKSNRSARLKQQIEQLRKEVAHWKRLVNESSSGDQSRRIVELERELSSQRSKSEAEMAALVLAHNEALAQYSATSNNQFPSESAQEPGSSSSSHQAGTSDGWQEAWDMTGSGSSAKNSAFESLQSENDTLKQDLTRLRAQMDEERRKNEEKSKEVDELTLRTVDAILGDAEREEMAKLRDDVKEAHALLDLQREKFEWEKKCLEEQYRASKETESKVEITDGDNAETDENLAMETEDVMQLIKSVTQKEKELDKLRRENNELTSAYNDLNDDFEKHKAEHGSVVVSNRDLTARIDALKANLIEYEERYELCKAENAETVQQLEKLTSDFDRLRLSFESTRDKTSSSSVEDVEKLSDELDATRDERERLKAQVQSFTSAIGNIDSELDSLRQSNERLARDNMAMGASLDKFIEVRDMLVDSDVELKDLRDKFEQLRIEHKLKEDEWQTELGQLKEARENAEKELIECKGRKVVVVEGHVGGEVDEKTSSQGTGDSTAEWEKMLDWDAAGGTAGPSNGVMGELKEALDMVTEKTDECEELRRQKADLAKELELRQNCVDELMAQTSALQSQQQLQAESFTDMRRKAERNDREKLEAQRSVVRLEEKLAEMDVALQNLTEQNQELRDRLESIERSENEKVADDMSSEVETAKEEHASELGMVKQQCERDLDVLRQEIDTVNERLKTALDSLAQANCGLEEAERIRCELMSLVEEKHKESTGYHAQLQTLLAKDHEGASKLTEYQDTIDTLRTDLTGCNERKEKAERELQRLREHMMSVEETSNKEAVLAEERETELRKRVRELEYSADNNADTVIQSANTYQLKISELCDEIDDVKKAKDEAVENLRVRERMLNDTQKALSNLHTVLRDVSNDNEARIEQQDQAIEQLKAQIQTLNDELSLLKNKEQSLLVDKQVLEDSTAHLKGEITRRETVIDELEVQLEERAQSTASTTYRVDDQTLRQLFLSYFTAEKDKQADIAMLLASVLGYDRQDVAKIQAANQSAFRGWFGLGGPSRQSQQDSSSISEQFIMFLEKESNGATSRALPLERSDNQSTMRSPSVVMTRSEPPSQEELRSFVDES